jgi:cobalamin biosynthesis protein CobT
VEAAPEKMESLVAKGESQFDVQFIKDSAELIAECRYVLQYTFIYAFFEKDEGRRNLFEFAQKDLEVYTEKMSGLTEIKAGRTLDAVLKDRDTIVDNVRVLTRFLANILHYEPLGSDKRDNAEDDGEDDAGGDGGGDGEDDGEGKEGKQGQE